MEIEMDEKESFARLNYGDEHIDATEDNTEVYSHNPKIIDALGSLASRDHVFIHLNETSGAYVWRHNPFYEDLVRLALEHEVPVMANLRKVAECDQQAFERSLLADIGDGIPDDWV